MARDTLTGSRIRERRIMSGLKQAELARMADISPSYLNLIEHNRRRIGGKLLLDIAEVLEVEPQVARDFRAQPGAAVLEVSARSGSSSHPVVPGGVDIDSQALADGITDQRLEASALRQRRIEGEPERHLFSRGGLLEQLFPLFLSELAVRPADTVQGRGRQWRAGTSFFFPTPECVQESG